MSSLNDRIKQRRTDLNLTLLDVANFLGVKEATAQRYESGEIKNIKHETIVNLAELLKCSPAYLMGWTNEISVPVKPQIELNDFEIKLIKKLRTLDSKGVHTVRTILEMEFDRINKPHLTVVAAHNDDYSEEQQRLMREDLDEL